jgi:hypothetical protein
LERIAKVEAAVMNKQQDQYVRELKSAITPGAMDAVKHLTKNDLSEAANNLRNNKESILTSFEEKLERDRLELTDIDEEDEKEAQKVIDQGKDPNGEELKEVLKKKKKTPADKKVVEDAIKTKKKNFFQRDLETMGKIIRGEKASTKDKNNFITAMSILGRYAMVGAGVTLIALGGAPLAIHIAKEIYDSWSSTSSGEEEQEYTIEHAYNAIVDHLTHVDLDMLSGMSDSAKFTAVASSVRISYRSVEDEKMLPVAQRTRWRVMLAKNQIGEIYNDHGTLSQPNLRIWKAYVTQGFNALDFPHLDDPDKIKEPYIVTNDDKETEHNLELHCPLLMTLQEARNWVCQIVEKGDNNVNGIS